MGTLAWVRELVSMIHLAKFTGAPASQAEELVAQIATAIEGISAVTWQDSQSESHVRPSRPASLPTPIHRGDSSMRLFRRIGDIIAANLNDLVDRFEDPEVMLKQAIREMETMIEDATAAAARAIAGERLLARDLSDHEDKARRWKARAEAAVRDGDDDLARQAIARSLEHQAMFHALAEQQSSAERTAQALRGQIDAMRAKQAEARRKLASLSARRQMGRGRPRTARIDLLILARSQRLRALRTNVPADRSGRGGGPGPGRTLRERPNPTWRPKSNRASKPSASRPSSPRSRSGSGPPRDPSNRNSDYAGDPGPSA